MATTNLLYALLNGARRLIALRLVMTIPLIFKPDALIFSGQGSAADMASRRPLRLMKGTHG